MRKPNASTNAHPTANVENTGIENTTDEWAEQTNERMDAINKGNWTG